MTHRLIIQKYVEASEKGDLQATMALFSDEASLRDFNGRLYPNKEVITKFYAKPVPEQFRIEIVRYEEKLEVVYVTFEFTWKSLSSPIVTNDEIHIRDNKIFKYITEYEKTMISEIRDNLKDYPQYDL